MKRKTSEIKEGFTLLLAVLITSILLTVSMGFSVFVLRELAISVIGRESQKAVFASDSGIECALYWDFVHSGLSQSAFATSSTSVISCAGSNPTVGGPSGISNFTLNFDNGACAAVRVDKIASYPNVMIEAKGYNTCAPGAANRVERAFRVIY